MHRLAHRKTTPQRATPKKRPKEPKRNEREKKGGKDGKDERDRDKKPKKIVTASEARQSRKKLNNWIAAAASGLAMTGKVIPL